MPTPAPHIAIVGTGVAGLMAGRYLRALLPNSRIAFYDAATSSGGRLQSITVDNDGGVVELGGARFHPQYHPRVHALVAELGLPTHPYECKLSPVHSAYSGHIREVLRDILARLQAAFDVCEPTDRSRWSFPDAAARLLGEDARDLLVTAVGYDSVSHPNMSFEGGMDLLRNHPETATLWGGVGGWLTPAAGFQAVTDSLEGELRESCTFNYRHGLRSLSTSAVCCELAFEAAAGARTEHADYVVFAMPLRDLERVQGVRVPKVVADAVVDVPLAKGYFEFDAPWWAGLQLEAQCITTSTCFRKIYFPAKGRCLQVYCDGPSALALRDLVANGTKDEVAAAFCDALLDAVPVPVAHKLVAEARTGWAFWERGVSFWKPGLRLMPSDCLAISERHYFCSDLCTTANGWVEGALVSAQATARKISEHAHRRATELDVMTTADAVEVRA